MRKAMLLRWIQEAEARSVQGLTLSTEPRRSLAPESYLLRLTIPWIGFDGLLDLAFQQIRHYAVADAAGSLRLMRTRRSREHHRRAHASAPGDRSRQTGARLLLRTPPGRRFPKVTGTPVAPRVGHG